MATHDRARASEPLGTRFRQQLTAEVLHDRTSIVIGGTTFRAADLLEATGNGFIDVFRRWKQETWLPTQQAVLEECLPDKTGRKRYEELKRRVRAGSVVAFVGSGIAKPFGYPLWVEFLRGLLRWADGIDEAMLSSTVRDDGYEDAASYLCECIHPRHWDEQLLAEFGAPLHDPTDVQAAAQWIPLLSPKVVVTTNYDPILEMMFDLAGLPFRYVLAGTEVGRFRNLRSQDERCLIKIHGDRENPSTRVLTREEYEQAYAPNSEGRRELTLLFQNSSLLFLGCSLSSDRTMELLFDIAQKDGGMPPHFALMKRPDDWSETVKRDAFLIERGIHALWYPQDHDIALEGVLGMLAMEAGRLEWP